MTSAACWTAGRTGPSVRRYGVIVVATLLLAGCDPAQTSRHGGDGSPGTGVVQGAAGGNGGDGGNGMDGADGATGADGSPGVSDSGTGSITGSGRMTHRQLDLSGVTDLVVGATFVVTVRIGEPEQATVTMDDNLTEAVEAAVIHDQLRLDLKPGASIRDATLSADVTVRHLDRLTASGVSKVTFASPVTGAELVLDASGMSKITGVVRVEHVEAAASGAGTLKLSGEVGRLELRAAGTARLPLSDLAVRDLDAILSGASCAAVAVSDTLAAQTSGTSTLGYSGAPRITRQQTSGVSSITADSPGNGGSSASDRCGS